jgi:CheY-like chemotaxis protein/anti-sigma regulatory factor (Ser/Thr protein kinase)
MSHELRTPLNAILGFGQLLEMDTLAEEQRECVEQINRGGKHLLTLINEVLDITRIESGRMDVSLEPVRVDGVFREALELVRPLGISRGITFKDKLDPGKDHSVLADMQKLKQVLLNLLANAIKYNRSQGEVTIDCGEVAPGRMRLAVSDTGPGIPPEKFGRLFMPFDRLGVEGNIEGSGLGLALSKALVQLMGGSLTVVSNVGKGSRFCVELNSAELSPPAVTTDYRTAPTANTSTESHTVLYIEDNLDNVKLVQRVLANRPGISLVTAMQGSLGIDLAREHHPDLILLDVHLPDQTGDQVLKRLRTIPETQDIPVVVISADATNRQVEKMRAAGACQYITKPINVPMFLDAVDAHLNKGN